MDAMDAAQRLIDATAEWFPFSTVSEVGSNDELTVAGLARCRRLLWGMMLLHEDGGDLAGSQFRTLYETFVSAVYLLFGGDQARTRLEANDQHERRKSATAFIEWLSHSSGDEDDPLLVQARAVMAEPVPAEGQLSLFDMAKAARRLATAGGETDSDFYERAYAFVFRPESYMAVHGGLGTMCRHFDRDAREIRSEGWGYKGSDRRLEVAIAMVAGLASKLADRLGLDRTKLDAFGASWTPRSP